MAATLEKSIAFVFAIIVGRTTSFQVVKGLVVARAR
jgi:hypothetical protein